MMSDLITFVFKLALFACLIAYVGSCSYRKVIEDQVAVQKLLERCK